MPIFFPPPPKFFLPKPAIIRPVEPSLVDRATFPFPIVSPKVTPAISPITYVGRSTPGTYSGGTYTWASAPIATGASDVLVIGISRESPFGSSTTGLTVAGSSATLWSPGTIVLVNAVVGYIEFYYCQPGALATANIVSSATSQAACIMAWRLSGVTSTPLDVVPSLQATSTSVVLNDIETKVSGGVIAMGVSEPAIANWTQSWSGSETVIEDADFTSASGNHRVMGCHFATTSASTTQDLTLTLSASQAHIGGALSFGP